MSNNHITGPRFLTTKNGNMLHFIPVGTLLSAGAKPTGKDQYIYTDKTGKYLMAKHEEKTCKPINQIEWGFLKNQTGVKIEATQENFLPRLATALAAREVALAKRLRNQNFAKKGSTQRPFAGLAQKLQQAK